MKNRCLLAVLCLFGAASLHAQIRVDIQFDQETYLPEEPLYAVVLIYNSSGQTLHLGSTPDWLSFTVESSDGKLVREKKPADVLGAFALPNASRAKRRVNLAEAFDLSRYAAYNVTATVRIPEWGQSYKMDRARHFAITPGAKLWESRFGIPPEKPGAAPEIRKFLLLQSNHMQELTLYVRITDANEGETFSLFPLGPLISFSQPEPQLDRWSNLHVLYQDGPRSFRYTMITPDGLLLTRQTWEISNDSRPQMVMNSDGRIEVKGGVRRISGTDLPPPELLSEKSNPPAELLGAVKPAHADKSKK